MLVVHDHCVKVGRAVNNGRPGFVVRGTYYATFSYPRILRKVEWGQFPAKPRDGVFLGV